MTRTRIGMMLPGAVSLGAYEGGALAAILAAVQAAKGELVVDSLASASAGSITAVVASRALLHGANPFKLMAETWVELPALKRLKAGGHLAPLTMHGLEDAARDLLGGTKVPDGGDSVYRQDVAVRLSMALTTLGGMSYRLPKLEGNDDERTATSLLATTNLDWFSATFEPGVTTEQLLAAVDGALASGSTPVGFSPRLLDRTADKEEYKKRGVVNPDDDWHVWYSDGGDIENEPFGRLLDLIEDTPTDDADERVIILLQTIPPTPERVHKWFDSDAEHVPTWTSTLMRVSHIQKSQNYYDDLRKLEKTNSRLGWVDAVAGSIDGLFTELLGRLTTAERPEAEAKIRTVLRAAEEAIERDQRALESAARQSSGTDVNDTAAPAPAAAEAPSVRSLLQQATGLHGKQRVEVKIISPDIDPAAGRPAGEQLAGEFLFHFGGFLDVRYRQNDFDLGVRNAMTFLASWLPGRVTNPQAVLETVQQGFKAVRDWPDRNEGDASLGKVPWTRYPELALLVGHILHVVEYGLRHDVTDDEDE